MIEPSSTQGVSDGRGVFALLFGAVAAGAVALVLAPLRRREAEPVSQDARRAEGAASGVLNGALPTRRVSSLVYDQRSGDSVADGASPALTGALYAGTD